MSNAPRNIVTRPESPQSRPGRVRSESPPDYVVVLGESQGRVRESDRRGESAGASQNDRVARGTRPLTAGRSQVRGGTRDPLRGEWCTPRWLAEAVGPFDLDPFSNSRSHIIAAHACWLERGDDGFGNGSVGSYFRTIGGQRSEYLAHQATSVWIQPPYERSFVERALRHYLHTRWCALLRFDPRPPWFDVAYDHAELVAVIRKTPDGKPFGFEPPPGVRASSLTFPHALFFKHASDATPEVLRHCAAWRKRVQP